MKKLFSLTLAAAMALSLAACGGAPYESTAPPPIPALPPKHPKPPARPPAKPPATLPMLPTTPP